MTSAHYSRVPPGGRSGHPVLLPKFECRNDLGGRLLAIRGNKALPKTAAPKFILLCALGFDDTRGDGAANLGGPFEAETRGDRGEEACAETIANSGGIDGDDAFNGLDVDLATAVSYTHLTLPPSL